MEQFLREYKFIKDILLLLVILSSAFIYFFPFSIFGRATKKLSLLLLLVGVLVRFAIAPFIIWHDFNSYLAWEGDVNFRFIYPPTALLPWFLWKGLVFRHLGSPTIGTNIFDTFVPPATLLLLKLPFLLSDIFSTALLYRIVKYTTGTTMALFVGTLYSIHPIFMFTAAVDARFDVFVVTLLLAAIYLLLKERFGSALAMILFASSLRVYPIILVPLCFLFLQKSKILRTILSQLPILVAIGLFSYGLPLWFGYPIERLISFPPFVSPLTFPGFGFEGSIHTIVADLFGLIVSEIQYGYLVRAMAVSILLFYAYVFIRNGSRPYKANICNVTSLLMLVFIIFQALCPTYHSSWSYIIIPSGILILVSRTNSKLLSSEVRFLYSVFAFYQLFVTIELLRNIELLKDVGYFPNLLIVLRFISSALLFYVVYRNFIGLSPEPVETKRS